MIPSKRSSADINTRCISSKKALQIKIKIILYDISLDQTIIPTEKARMMIPSEKAQQMEMVLTGLEGG